MSLKETCVKYFTNLNHHFWSRGVIRLYDKFFLKAENSPAHSAFCERVYGKDLCQHGMMDMEQLEKLLEVLKLNKDNHVLELGCGSGLITRYISDLTGAAIIGVDYSKTAVKLAQQRAHSSKNRLSFMKDNIQKLSFPPGNFDTIIAIDVLHLVNPLADVIRQLKSLLKTGGQMGIFFTQRIFGTDSIDLLLPEKTHLAQALNKNSLDFKTWNFSDEEANHWQKKVKVLEELKPEFEAEKSHFLYKFRYSEAKAHTQNPDKRARYLYHVQT